MAEEPQLAEVVVTAERREENLSKVPISVSALTQEDMDTRGIKDIADVARFTPGINIDNSGTSNISIRGIASSGGAGTTGIYIDDTPIQMRALAFNPDETVPKSFDIDRIEVLRGPQGTLFGAGSEGGTVRYITTQPSLTKYSVYSRDEVSYTQGGQMNYEAGIAAGGPVIDDVFGARATVWARYDGGWINRVNPTGSDPQHDLVDSNTNHASTVMIRVAGLWKVADNWKVAPSIYYQNRQTHDVSNYWIAYSNPGNNDYVSGNGTTRGSPDKFYLPALKIEGDLGPVTLISNTSYFHRNEVTGYDGTEYNLGFYQTFASVTPSGFQDLAPGVGFPLLDGTGYHLPAAIANYRSPASINNDQQNFTQELRVQSNDPDARFVWTAGVFFTSNRQQYLEQIHDPLLENFTETVFGTDFPDLFSFENPVGSGNFTPVNYDPRYPDDSYFLNTHARDKQYAVFGEGSYGITDNLKLTVGARFSKTEYQFDTETGGPQLFLTPVVVSASEKDHSFTPRVNLSWQMDPNNMVYATYAKGFRPGGGNNPVPYAACSQDFQSFGISSSPLTYRPDTVDSYEIGAKNNVAGRIRLASSLYLIKWHNIQQTVIPPICQISFIQNLGEATAKGGDIQADIALTDALTAEVTAGYTEARYSRDSGFPSSVIVSKGDAITGESEQPPPPVTASVGLQYEFAAFEHKSFVRLDYEFQGRNKWLPPRQDPTTSQYDPANFTLSATHFVSMRAGTTVGAWQIEPFVDNLFDTHVLTNYDWSIDPGTGDSRLERGYTFRPRTYGVTATFRY
jgi:iron complex outermembrane recepter protein